MKFILTLTSFLFLSGLMASNLAQAETSVFSQPLDSQTYGQLFSIQAGPFQPKSAVISNGSYAFDYGSATKSFLLEAGWSTHLFWAFGNFYFNENFAYSQLSGVAPPAAIAGNTDSSLSVNMFGFDTRLVDALEWFPVRWIIPFFEGGYQYTFYSQSGSVDLDSVQGGVGNPVAGAGLRFWVNRRDSGRVDTVHAYESFPVFVTLKWNRVFSNSSNGLNLADSSVLGGLSIGL
jgi:hypothetical protein